MDSHDVSPLFVDSLRKTGVNGSHPEAKRVGKDGKQQPASKSTAIKSHLLVSPRARVRGCDPPVPQISSEQIRPLTSCVHRRTIAIDQAFSLYF